MGPIVAGLFQITMNGAGFFDDIFFLLRLLLAELVSDQRMTPGAGLYLPTLSWLAHKQLHAYTTVLPDK